MDENVELTEDYYSLFLTFYKVGEDNNKVLKNEEYEIYTVDGVATGVVLGKTESGRFLTDLYYSGTNAKGKTLITIPEVVKEKLRSLETIDEARTIATTYNLSTSEWETLHKTYIGLPFPIILKPIATEDGYKPKDIYIKGNISVELVYDATTGKITSKKVSLLTQHFREIEYAEELGKTDTFEDLMSIQYTRVDRESDDNEDIYSCINTNAGMIITEREECTEVDSAFSASYNLVPYFYAERGTVTYEIENTVNGVAKYNASKEKDLEYKISVKNTGDVVSTENEITTYVPKEVKVDETKISDDGEYNKNDHTITWEIDRIEVDETVELTYKATAPESVNGKELVGYSTVKSTYVAGVTQSSNTVVTLDKVVEIIKNPETGTMVYIANTNIGLPLSYLVVLVLLISLVLVAFIRKFKKIK